MSFFFYHTKGHRRIILFLDYALTCSQIIMLTLSPIQVLFIFTQSRIRKGKHFSSQHFLKNHYMCPPKARNKKRMSVFISTIWYYTGNHSQNNEARKEGKGIQNGRGKTIYLFRKHNQYICLYVSVYICVCLYIYIHTCTYNFLSLIYIKEQQQQN